MSSATSFCDALHEIGSRIDGEMSEKDIENAFLNEDFYSSLGYEGAGHDLRSEMTLPDNRRPDYITLDDNESVTAVYEFKTSGEDLSDHENQLFHYVRVLKADYGVLTNGEEFRLFRREGETRMLTLSLSEATESHTNDIRSALRKPDWDIRDPESVNEYLSALDTVGLDTELGREHFFDTFRLETDCPFADLVTAMMDLLAELRDERDAAFVTGAYDFWEASYADVPDETPDSWEPFTDGKSLRDFMFSLESGHALLARLLLAKATEDHDFFPTERGLERYFGELGGGFSGTIDLDAYPIAANGMIEDMRDQLVESLFEDDIFIWWTEGYGEQTASQHGDQFSRFRDVAREGSAVTNVSPATRERFSRAIARVAFAVLKFDFASIEGDPLGDLYQRYFDPETRKALGEFYTPKPVIDYIMDGVGYDRGVSTERIIDPSCGSGTFLVEAVNRYLDDVRRYEDDPDWAAALTQLCSHPHIVGLDVHPFAVLMAQIRFMVAILPEYKKAKRGNPSFTIRRLPIFRTDSLRNERELTGLDLGDGGTQMTFDAVTEDNQDVRIPVPLPIEVGDDVPESEREGEFLVQRVRMPLFETVALNSDVRNFGEYFAALQGVLDVVKWHMSQGWWDYGGGLREGIERYTTREYEGIEEFFAPYVDDILDTVRYLKDEHGDGRLFKMFEDTVLALVVKNYMEYDYVVGNPPYVNIRNIPASNREMYNELYKSAYWRYDLYVLFLERGLEWLNSGGKLGYITSNKFTRSRYGQKIRKMITSDYSLAQYVEFGDVDIFADATNFASILIIDRDQTRNEVPYAKVHEGGEEIFGKIREQIGTGEIISESLELSNYPLSELTDEGWRFTPEKVRSVAKNVESEGSKRIGDVATGVREGVKSGGDEVFLVSPDFAEEHDLEDELLRPIIRGKNVRRWQVQWEDEYAIYPYDENGDIVDIDQYPNTKSYLDDNEEYLEDRHCVRNENKGIYDYHRSHSLSVFEGDFRIATPDISTNNNFSHTNGYNCFASSVYSVTFSNDQPYSEKCLLGYLNSSVSEFIIKQSSPPLRGRPFRYRYQSDHVNKIPLAGNSEQIEEIVNKILQLEKLSERISAFPGSYMDDYQGELDYIDYEWQTRRYPVSAKIQEKTDSRLAVTAGRSDELTHPLLDRGDHEENRLRARYVHAAVDGRNVKSGEETTIPMPSRRSDVEDLMAALEADQTTVAETDIEGLEAKIDTAVYDLFELTAEERAAIEEYLEVF